MHFLSPQLHELSTESEEEGENSETSGGEEEGEEEEDEVLFTSLTTEVLSTLNMTPGRCVCVWVWEWVCVTVCVCVGVCVGVYLCVWVFEKGSSACMCGTFLRVNLSNSFLTLITLHAHSQISYSETIAFCK